MAKSVLIVNPQARDGWAQKKWPVIEPMLRDALGVIDVQFTKQPGDGIPMAKAAAEQGAGTGRGTYWCRKSLDYG